MGPLKIINKKWGGGGGGTVQSPYPWGEPGWRGCRVPASSGCSSPSLSPQTQRGHRKVMQWVLGCNIVHSYPIIIIILSLYSYPSYPIIIIILSMYSYPIIIIILSFYVCKQTFEIYLRASSVCVCVCVCVCVYLSSEDTNLQLIAIRSSLLQWKKHILHK